MKYGYAQDAIKKSLRKACKDMNILQNRQNGFGLVLIAGIVILFGLIGFIVWQAWSNNKDREPQTDQQSNTDQQDSISDGYKRYNEPKGKFSFVYPISWEMVAPAQIDGEIIALVRPTLKETIRNATNQNGVSTYDGPQFSLVVSHWNDVNQVLKDENYVGKRTYSNLSDFLSDQHVPVKKIGEIVVDGVNGYEVINPGVVGQYAFLLERQEGIYQIEFSDVAKKENLSNEDKKIIESLKFN